MKYHVIIEGDSLPIEIVEEDGAIFVLHEGRRIPVELAIVRKEVGSLVLDGRSLPVVASGDNEDLTISLGSETWRCSVMDERENLAAAALGEKGGRHGGGVVKAVMPGIVREVLVGAGVSVRRGQALLILEAMKMQNEVRADADGQVLEVLVRAGAAVAKGDPLVTLG